MKQKNQYVSNQVENIYLVPLKILILFTLFSSSQPISAQLTTTVDQIVYDMVGAPFRNQGGLGEPWGAHEGLPHGVPTDWDWYYGARPLLWMNSGNNKALSSWGQVFEWEGGSPVSDVRFQIRNHRMYVYTNQKWILAEDVSANIEAGLFRESDYGWTGLIPYRAEKRSGGISYPIKSGFCLHWFKQVWRDKKRYQLPDSFEAIFICYEIRMIPGSSKTPSVANAKYLAAVGADYYFSPDTQGKEQNPSLVISRHKFLSSEWQTVTAYIAGSIPDDVNQYKNEILKRPLPPNVVVSSVL